MIICAGDIEQFDFATPVGVGLVNVSINLTRLCMISPPEFLLFVGTAGSYGKKKIFEIVESKTASNIENSFFTHNTYTPIDNLISTADDVSRETIINSSNYITVDPAVAKYYLDKRIDLENMEFFSVMKTAETFGIPAGGIFIVTNYCDQNAHKTFLLNHNKAKEQLAQFVYSKFPHTQKIDLQK